MAIPGFTPSTSSTLLPAVARSGINKERVVETFGPILTMTDAALAVRFTRATEAQPGDILWVGTAPDYTLYRMKEGEIDCRLAASWGRDTGVSVAKQIGLITYNDPALTSQLLEYSRTYYVDLRGTTETNRLTLQLPGAESTTETMEIILRDLPQETFDAGYLRIEALPDGSNSIQILTPQGLTDTSEAGVSAFSLKGSEIYLARVEGSDRWLMSLRLSGGETDVWVGPEASPPSPALSKIWIVSDADPGVVKFFNPATQIWEDIA